MIHATSAARQVGQCLSANITYCIWQPVIDYTIRVAVCVNERASTGMESMSTLRSL